MWLDIFVESHKDKKTKQMDCETKLVLLKVGTIFFEGGGFEGKGLYTRPKGF